MVISAFLIIWLFNHLGGKSDKISNNIYESKFISPLIYRGNEFWVEDRSLYGKFIINTSGICCLLAWEVFIYPFVSRSHVLSAFLHLSSRSLELQGWCPAQRPFCFFKSKISLFVYYLATQDFPPKIKIPLMLSIP